MFDDLDSALDSPKFNKAFWDWFDSLPQDAKSRFNYYKSDMAKINFYNSVWKKKLTSNLCGV